MKKLIIYLICSYIYMFAGDFGTILTNAIVTDTLGKYDKNIIENIHKGLLQLANESMSEKIRSKGERLVIKFFNQDDPDIKIENKISESVQTIVEESAQYEQTKDTSEDIGGFKNFGTSTDGEFDPIGTMVHLISDIKKFYGNDNGLPLVTIYSSNGNNSIELKALFSIVYKIIYDKNTDRKYLNIDIVYSSTNITKDENGKENLIVQELNKKIAINKSDKISRIAGIIYKPLNQKISNLINDELGK